MTPDNFLQWKRQFDKERLASRVDRSVASGRTGRQLFLEDSSLFEDKEGTRTRSRLPDLTFPQFSWRTRLCSQKKPCTTDSAPQKTLLIRNERIKALDVVSATILMHTPEHQQADALARLISAFAGPLSSQRHRKQLHTECKALLGSISSESRAGASGTIYFILLSSLTSSQGSLTRTHPLLDDIRKASSVVCTESALLVLQDLANDRPGQPEALPSSLKRKRKSSFFPSDSPKPVHPGSTSRSTEMDEIMSEELSEVPPTCIGENEVISACLQAMQGIQNSLMGWETFETFTTAPFAPLPPFDPLEDPEGDSEQENTPEEASLLQERLTIQQMEESLAQQHCQVQTELREGMRVREGLRAAIPSSQVEIADKIVHLGTLHVQLERGMEQFGGECGLVMQGALAQVRSQMTSFYAALADIDPSQISLRWLLVWSLPFTRRFSFLVLFLREVERCDASGGQILTILHKLTHHGNPEGEIALPVGESELKEREWSPPIRNAPFKSLPKALL